MLRAKPRPATFAEILKGCPDFAQALPPVILDIIADMFYGLCHVEKLHQCLRPQPSLYTVNGIAHTKYPVVMCRRHMSPAWDFVRDAENARIAERWPIMSEAKMIYGFRADFFFRTMIHAWSDDQTKRKKTTIHEGFIWLEGQDLEAHKPELERRGYVMP
jgi:hypothetical protein